jgi:hypothetical protein
MPFMTPPKPLFVGLTLLVAVVYFAGDGWVVRQDGVGPVKVGMSLSQLNLALQEKFVMPQDKEDQGCFYVTSTKHPQVSFMIENGRLVRIDVDKRGVAT